MPLELARIRRSASTPPKTLDPLRYAAARNLNDRSPTNTGLTRFDFRAILLHLDALNTCNQTDSKITIGRFPRTAQAAGARFCDGLYAVPIRRLWET